MEFIVLTRASIIDWYNSNNNNKYVMYLISLAIWVISTITIMSCLAVTSTSLNRASFFAPIFLIYIPVLSGTTYFLLYCHRNYYNITLRDDVYIIGGDNDELTHNNRTTGL